MEKNPILDMKGLSYSMSHLFDYLRDVACLSHAQVFQVFFKFRLYTHGQLWMQMELI